MLTLKNIRAVESRYGGLANSTCCLSCGGAADLGKAEPGETVVDLGSGQGADVLKLAAAVGDRGFVFGVDTSEGMIRRARRTAEKMGVNNIRFIHGAFEHIGLDDCTADLVISNCSINHSEDKPRVWSEVYRILKPGGRFVVSDITAMEPVPERYRNDPEDVAECWAGAELRASYLAHVAAAGLGELAVSEESQPYRRGQAVLASFTLSGRKPRAEEVME